MALSKENMEEAEREYEKHGYIPITEELSRDVQAETLAAIGKRSALTKEEREGIKQRRDRFTEKSLYVDPDKKGREMYKEPIGPKRNNVEPIITNEKEYENYQREQMEEDAEARAHPKATTQYESPIGPTRPPSTSFGEKFGVKISNFKEGIKSGVGNIKRTYKENAEYNRQLRKRESELKSSPGYLKTKAEHDLYMEEIRARKQGSAVQRRGSISPASFISMGSYKPVYGGQSIGGLSGGYKSAYTGQMINLNAPVKQSVKAPVKKLTPVKITSFGSGAMPKMGNFGGSSLMPKIGGGGKKMESVKIGSGLLGSIPKIGKLITHKGSPQSINVKTNIGILGEIPKFGFGLKKKAPVK